MAFFSSISLCTHKANPQFSSEAIVQAAIDEGVINSKDQVFENTWSLQSDLSKLFQQPAWIERNDSLFCPDTLSIHTEIQLSCLNMDGYESRGICISFSGHGYFFPLKRNDLERVFLGNNKVAHFGAKVTTAFKGKFRMPIFRHKKLFSQWSCPMGSSEWLWLFSQTG